MPSNLDDFFFLEKNMLSYFLHIMRQKSGGSSFVCVQLLQTLNILFANIRNETSLTSTAMIAFRLRVSNKTRSVVDDSCHINSCE
uniref:FPL domain-containing protein n=1 Tax=Glossina palpalis gambiensis TaxID=67801 RepID=A0A1B0BHK2_9MUSC